MSGLLDKSMIIRYFTGDPSDAAEQAQSVIKSDEELYLTDAILMEVGFVLITNYRVSRTDAVEQMITLVLRTNVRMLGLDNARVVQALEFCRPSNRVSFADAMIWAAAVSSDIRRVYTFDRRFPNDGIELRDSLH